MKYFPWKDSLANKAEDGTDSSAYLKNFTFHLPLTYSKDTACDLMIKNYF